MLEWLQAASAWMQGWLNPNAGLVGVFVSALLVIIVNFAVDVAYARLDPRIAADA